MKIFTILNIVLSLLSSINLTPSDIPQSPESSKIKEVSCLQGESNLGRVVTLLDLNTSDIESKEAFKQWFVGFVDAEGSFRINAKDNNRFEFSLAISLHKDDMKVLEIILQRLNLPNKIYTGLNSGHPYCSISLGNKQILTDIIIPIFNKYPLLTKKHYDFSLWLEAFNLYNSTNLKERGIISQNILDIKNKMNKLSEDKSNYPTTEFCLNHININWLIGFIEGDGTFGLKKQKNTIYLQIAQHKASEQTMEAILIYLSTLKPVIDCPIIIKDKINNKLYGDKDKKNIQIYNLDYFYWVIIPMFYNKLHSRKRIDFILWACAVVLKKHGLLNIDSGIALFTLIRENINKRYFEPNFPIETKLIKDVLNHEPLYDLTKTHEYNYRRARYINNKNNI